MVDQFPPHQARRNRNTWGELAGAQHARSCLDTLPGEVATKATARGDSGQGREILVCMPLRT